MSNFHFSHLALETAETKCWSWGDLDLNPVWAPNFSIEAPNFKINAYDIQTPTWFFSAVLSAKWLKILIAPLPRQPPLIQRTSFWFVA
jgi:hypothetical protein